eukprot:scaffold881_cov123-Isochrysis_galbana.AAC.16
MPRHDRIAQRRPAEHVPLPDGGGDVQVERKGTVEDELNGRGEIGRVCVRGGEAHVPADVQVLPLGWPREPHLDGPARVCRDGSRAGAARPRGAEGEAGRGIVVTAAKGVLQHGLQDVEGQAEVPKIGRERPAAQPVLGEPLQGDVHRARGPSRAGSGRPAACADTPGRPPQAPAPAPWSPGVEAGSSAPAGTPRRRAHGAPQPRSGRAVTAGRAEGSPMLAQPPHR